MKTNTLTIWWQLARWKLTHNKREGGQESHRWDTKECVLLAAMYIRHMSGNDQTFRERARGIAERSPLGCWQSSLLLSECRCLDVFMWELIIYIHRFILNKHYILIKFTIWKKKKRSEIRGKKNQFWIENVKRHQVSKEKQLWNLVATSRPGRRSQLKGIAPELRHLT